MFDKALQTQLQKILDNRGVLITPQELTPFSRDASRICSTPSLVLQPQTTTQIVEVVRLAHENRLPITIRGAGTGLDGGSVASRGGLLLSLGKLNRVVEISPEDMTAVVQPGVITARINAHLRPWGLFYPIDPASQSQCTIGGDVATDAHGLRGTKYGFIGNYLLGLEAVVPPGEIIRCGAKTLKCATGYHLVGLLAGSRGRIGVISEIILKLLPRPQAQTSLMAIFDAVEQTQRAKEALGKKHIWPSRLEWIDGRAVEKSALREPNLGLSPNQMLLLAELDGPESVVKEDLKAALRIMAQEGAKEVRPAENDQEAAGWWQARGALLSSLVGERDLAVLLTVIMPGSKTGQFFQKIAEAATGKSVAHIIYGHLGEERWHIVFPVEKDEAPGKRAVGHLAGFVHKTAASLGGRSLRPYAIGFAPGTTLSLPPDPGQEKLGRALKAHFDPKGIFNPFE